MTIIDVNSAENGREEELGIPSKARKLEHIGGEEEYHELRSGTRERGKIGRARG